MDQYHYVQNVMDWVIQIVILYMIVYVVGDWELWIGFLELGDNYDKPSY